MDNNNQKNTNIMAILGLIFSFFISIIGLIFSIIALNQIKETHEEGKGLAVAGIVISIVKLIFIIGMVILSVVFTTTVWGSLKENIMESAKCSYATNCEYDETSGNYNCIYEDGDGVDEYIICDEDSIPIDEKKSTYYSSHRYNNTFDYDAEF